LSCSSGVQLGGGADIDQAIAYCQTLVTRPRNTVLVLITDLYEALGVPAPARRTCFRISWPPPSSAAT